MVRDRKNFSEVSNFAAGLPEGVRQNKQHYTSLLLFAKVMCVPLFFLSKSKTFFDFVLLAKMLCEYRSDNEDCLAIMKAHFERIFADAKARGLDMKIDLIFDDDGFDFHIAALINKEDTDNFEEDVEQAVARV